MFEGVRADQLARLDPLAGGQLQRARHKKLALKPFPDQLSELEASFSCPKSSARVRCGGELRKCIGHGVIEVADRAERGARESR